MAYMMIVIWYIWFVSLGYLIHLNFSNYKTFSLHFMDICYSYIHCYNYLIILLCFYFITIVFIFIFIIDILMKNPSHHSNSSSSSSPSEDEGTKLEVTRVFLKNIGCVVAPISK